MHERTQVPRVTDLESVLSAEAALANDPDFISAVLGASRALVVVLDTEGRIVKCNPACERITGYQAGELRGQILWDVFHRPEDRAKSRRRFDAILSACATSVFEEEWIGKSGEGRRISFSNSVLVGNEGTPRFVIATGIEAPSPRPADHAQLDGNQFRSIWEASDAPMCLTSERGIILKANDAFARIVGKPADSLPATDIAALCIPEDQPAVRDLYAERPASLEFRSKLSREVHFAGGASGWFDISVSRVEVPGLPSSLLSVFRDATEYRRSSNELADALETAETAHRDLAEANRYLEESGALALEMAERVATLSAAKAEFLGNMTHEIRTPLNGILGMLELSMTGELNQEQREYLELAKSSAGLLLTLVNDVLDYSQYETGRLTLNSSEFSLRGLLQQVISPWTAPAAVKRLPLEWSAQSNVADAWIGDPERLARILNNLVSNAIKFTESGEVTVHVETASVHGLRVELHFIVADTGIGVPPRKQRLIFEPFAQADGSTTRKYGGAGLGLPIASALVELMGGRIWVESKPGSGSKFHFTVLLSEATRVSAPDQTPNEERRTHILVAEDNIVNQRLATRLLQQEGYAVQVAATGKQALEMLDLGHFDLVLMDIQMPELDGLQATTQIRRNERGSGKRLPIVAVTAQVADSDRQRCFEAGMDAYLTKPMRIPELIRIIESVVPGGCSMNANRPSQGASVEEQIRQLDESVALSRVGGDFDLLREVVGLFLDDYPQAIEKMRAAVGAHDPSGVEHHAHSLKGSVSTFGAQQAFDAALTLERKGRSGDLTGAEESLRNLESVLEALRPELIALQNK